MDNRARTTVIWTFGSFILLSIVAAPCFAECNSVKTAAIWNGGSIALAFRPPVTERLVLEAVSQWSACPQYGKGFPTFAIYGSQDHSADRILEITHERHSQGARCAMVNGDRITLYSFARHPSTKPISCGNQAQNLAHELGHVLGLNHVTKSTECNFHIMSTINLVNAKRRRVTVGECVAVDQRWLTARERDRMFQIAVLPPG